MNLIFFDIDGTLLISHGAGGKSITRVLREIFGIQDEIAQIQIHGQTDRGIATQLFAAHSIDDSHENWVRFIQGYLEVLDEELEQSQGRLLPGIPDLLDQLAGIDHVELALLTGNIPEGARKKVDYFGIGNYFSWGGFGDEHRDRSDMARHALKVAVGQVGYGDSDQVFVIGDTPNDIRCGKAISAITIGVATAGYSLDELAQCQPDYAFKDLSQTEELMRILS